MPKLFFKAYATVTWIQFSCHLSIPVVSILISTVVSIHVVVISVQ